MDAATDIKKF